MPSGCPFEPDFGSAPFPTNPAIANDRKMYGNFINSFTSFRKLRCLIMPDDGSKTRKSWSFELYNPYDKEVPLENLKYGIGIL